MQGIISSSPQAVTATSPAAESKYSALRWFKGLGFWITLVVLMATMLEGIVFNHFYFRFALGDYQTVSVPLPYNEQLREHAYIFNPQQRSLSVQGLNLELMTIGFKLKGEHTIINGSLTLTDESSLVIPLSVNKFKVAPADINFSGKDLTNIKAAPYKLLVRSKGKASAFSLSFDDQLKGTVILTDLTLNVKPEFGFNFLRWLALIIIGIALVLLFKKRLYTKRLGQLSRTGFHIVQGLSLSLCLGVSLGYSYLVAPSHISPHLMFDFTEQGFIYLGNPEQSWLLEFPRTQQDVEYYDAYTQNLDALLKGQLNIDIAIETDVLNAANDARIYDTGWRLQNGIEGLWDRSFYNEKFYAYYGFGPVVLFYLPLYLITGQAPSPSLAVLFFSTVAVLGQFLAIYAVTRFYGVLPKANALIYGLSQAAAVLGTHFVCVQNTIWFYAYAALLCMGLIGLLTFLCYSIPAINSKLKKWLALVAIGIIIVLIVQTRPHMLFAAMIICCPIFWGLIKANQWQCTNNTPVRSYNLKDKLFDAICVSVPVVIGASITMTLNYLRFDSIFDFGQRYCFSGENLIVRAQYQELNLEIFSAMFYEFITNSWVELADFPFYGLSNEAPKHIGVSILSHNYVGLFASPIWWGLAFAFLLICSKNKEKSFSTFDVPSHLFYQNRYRLNQNILFKVTLSALLIFALIMCYMQFIMIVTSVRALMECLEPLIPFIVVLWIIFIEYDPTHSLQTKICYWVAILALTHSIIIDALAPFSVIEHFMPYLVPDDWISAQNFFTPISTVR